MVTFNCRVERGCVVLPPDKVTSLLNTHNGSTFTTKTLGFQHEDALGEDPQTLLNRESHFPSTCISLFPEAADLRYPTRHQLLPKAEFSPGSTSPMYLNQPHGWVIASRGQGSTSMPPIQPEPQLLPLFPQGSEQQNLRGKDQGVTREGFKCSVCSHQEEWWGSQEKLTSMLTSKWSLGLFFQQNRHWPI